MNNVAIIDYGLCNLDSIARATEECGGRPFVTSNPGELAKADRIILPGVGAFPDAMATLNKCGLVDAMRERVIERHIPFLGICLGMQLIAALGHEVRLTPGLGWIDGEVEMLRSLPGERVPHIGWNEVHYDEGCPLFKGISQDKDFYFVHSFHFKVRDISFVKGTTNYCGGFVSVVNKGHIFGVQFHPEKSQRPGFALLGNFLEL